MMFSIIMPAYNEEKYIHKAIVSVLEQELRDFELIVVDDGSTDKTAQIVEVLAKKDSRITFLTPGKVGKTSAFNLAAGIVKGDWLYFMGADDLLPKDALIHWANCIKDKDPLKKIAVCGRKKVISDNKKYDGLVLPKNKTTFNWSGPNTLMSRGMLMEVLPIPEHLPNEDSWWGLCINHFSDEKYRIDNIITFYRMHDGNAIAKRSTFKDFSHKYHLRQNAKRDFISKYENRLSDKDKIKLKQEINIEAMRMKGQFIKILMSSGSSFKYKMRAIFFSNKYLYKLKMALDRFMLGH